MYAQYPGSPGDASVAISTCMPEIAIDRSKSGLSYIPFAGKEVVRSIGLARRQTCARSAVFDQFVSQFSRP